MNRRVFPVPPPPLPGGLRRWLQRSYDALLLLYPKDTRQHFGADMCDAFLDLVAEARMRRGGFGVTGAVWRGFTDVLREAGRARIQRLPLTEHAAQSAPPGGLHFMIEDFVQDVRQALRGLRKTPGYTVAAVLTLALGIGANSAIFSVTRAALMQSPPVEEPASLVAVWTTCRAGDLRCSSSFPDYLDYRDRTSSLQDLAAYAFERGSLGGNEGARLISVQAATGNYWSVLGVEAGSGRVFNVEDDDNRLAVAVLTHALWNDHFGADPDIVGQTIRINRAAFEVIGVAPERFGGLHLSGSPDVIIPFMAGSYLGSGFFENDDRLENRGSRWIDQLVGRMNEGVAAEQVQAEMAALSDQMALEDPEARGPRSVTVESAERMLLPAGDMGELAGFVYLLGGVVAFTLLLACANLANLLLARTAGRRQEISIRLAVGAGKGRLVRQLLTESVVLAGIGGFAALVVGRWVIALLSAYQLPGGVAVEVLEAGMDTNALAFTALLSLGTGIAFGMVPALQASRTQMDASLRTGGRGNTRGWMRLRGGLVAAQLALCLVLVAGAGLFTQALMNGLDTNFGFDRDGLVVASLDLSLLHYDDQRGQQFVRSLTERLESHPGVVAAGVGTRAPMLRGGTATMLEAVGGYQPGDDEELRLEFTFVSDGYLEALGLPILEGRGLRSTDNTARRVMVVNREMADRWWPDGSAVGGLVAFFGDAPRESSGGQISFLPSEDTVGDVIGVVENTKWDDGITVPDYPFAYMPLAASGGGWVGGRIAVVARTNGDAAALLPILRSEIATLEPDASVMVLATMDTLLAELLQPQSMGTQLLGWFAVLALVLSTIGIYSVVAYSVSQQQRELGIRIALGAEGSSIRAQVVRSIAWPVAIGLITGVIVTQMLSDTMAGYLYGVSPRDPLTVAAVGIGLVAVAILASMQPARRATRVDPLIALRSD